ncbi:MAG: VanZ family protein [Pseudonocardiaceae bacterium]
MPSSGHSPTCRPSRPGSTDRSHCRESGRLVWTVAASCLLISGFAEYVQGATGGGTCQARDLVHNTAGGVLGALLAVALLELLERWPRRVSADRAAGPGSTR